MRNVIAVVVFAVSIAACGTSGESAGGPTPKDARRTHAVLTPEGYWDIYSGGAGIEDAVRSGEVFKSEPAIGFDMLRVPVAAVERARKNDLGDPITLSLCNAANDLEIHLVGSPQSRQRELQRRVLRAGALGVSGIAQVMIDSDGSVLSGYTVTWREQMSAETVGVSGATNGVWTDHTQDDLVTCPRGE
jgi:hypothetical protein